MLKCLQLTEMEKIRSNQLNVYVNFGPREQLPQSNSRYLVLNYVDFPSTLTLDVWKVLPYLQVWPGSEIQVGFWGLFLYSYPYCIDTWNSFNGTELRVSDVTTLKMQSGWPELSELERKLIDWLIGLAEVAPQIELARKDVFSKLKSVYLYFCPQSLTNFAAIDRGIDPEYLCIKIIPDESPTIVQELSSHKYENLERFSLEYLGHEGFVNVEAIASLLNFNQVKLISLSVS